METVKHPFFQLCFWLFLGHQLLQKIGQIPLGVVDSYLDPLLCLPLLLSLLLMERRWFWRSPQYTISRVEILLIVLLISVLCEVGFPRWSSQFTSDPLDVVAYALGGVSFHLLLNRTSDEVPQKII